MSSMVPYITIMDVQSTMDELQDAPMSSPTSPDPPAEKPHHEAHTAAVTEGITPGQPIFCDGRSAFT